MKNLAKTEAPFSFTLLKKCQRQFWKSLKKKKRQRNRSRNITMKLLCLIQWNGTSFLCWQFECQSQMMHHTFFWRSFFLQKKSFFSKSFFFVLWQFWKEKMSFQSAELAIFTPWKSLCKIFQMAILLKKLLIKKTEKVLNSLTICYLNVDHNMELHLDWSYSLSKHLKRIRRSSG